MILILQSISVDQLMLQTVLRITLFDLYLMFGI